MRQSNNYGYCISTRIKPGKLLKNQTAFKFKDLELEVYFLDMHHNPDCFTIENLDKESWRGGQRRTSTVNTGLQEN
jgi:hypothetical protein